MRARAAAGSVLLHYRGSLEERAAGILTNRVEATIGRLPEPLALRRRLFYVAMECVQNSIRHRHLDAALLTLSAGPDGYAITSGNAVHRTSVTSLAKKIRRINALDAAALTALYRRVIKRPLRPASTGAGLGLIGLARKSGKKLWFDFREMSKDYCFFRMRITVDGQVRPLPNKPNLMETLNLPGSDETPAVVLDKKKGTFQISGRSITMRAGEFYAPVIDWVRRYAAAPNAATSVIFKLEYFNTASAKQILDLLHALEGIKGVRVDWYFDDEDEDMEEAGQEFAELVKIPFTFKTN